MPDKIAVLATGCAASALGPGGVPETVLAAAVGENDRRHKLVEIGEMLLPSLAGCPADSNTDRF